MPLQDLNPAECHVVLECLRAIVDGPFISDDDEFAVLIGLERQAVRGVIDRWPVDDRTDEDARLAINNAMNSLLGYPHGRPDALPQYITVPRDDIARIFYQWRGGPAVSYFDGVL